MKNELMKNGYDIGQPLQMIDMADVLKGHIVKQKLYTNIKGKNYAHVEGWQFAGGLMGLYPRVTQVENLTNDKEVKWRADVELVRIKDDQVVGKGFALCSNKEGSKKAFDEYAILSMAQTRAIGKAYRNMVGWVMKAAGYEGTPAEEMKEEAQEKVVPTVPVKPKVTKTKEPIYECTECAKVITKQENDYSMKLYKRALCREDQKATK